MNKPNQNETENRRLRREIPFRAAPEEETNDGTSLFIEDQDRMVSIIVLVLACLGLALLAHAVV